MKVSEKELRKIISEAIERYIGQVDTNDSAFDIGLGIMGNFKISPRLMSAIYEAAFQILGYERFAINGEIVGDNSVMDNPWDDAYSILEWAIQNKDLDEKYLGRVSQQYSGLSDDAFKQYTQEIQSGRKFWFSKEELSDIFSKLPDVLRKELIKDMVNVGRIQKIQDTIDQLRTLNGGKNLQAFIDMMRNEIRGKKCTLSMLHEPVKQALTTTYMLNK